MSNSLEKSLARSARNRSTPRRCRIVPDFLELRRRWTGREILVCRGEEIAEEIGRRRRFVGRRSVGERVPQFSLRYPHVVRRLPVTARPGTRGEGWN